MLVSEVIAMLRSNTYHSQNNEATIDMLQELDDISTQLAGTGHKDEFTDVDEAYDAVMDLIDEDLLVDVKFSMEDGYVLVNITF